MHYSQQRPCGCVCMCYINVCVLCCICIWLITGLLNRERQRDRERGRQGKTDRDGKSNCNWDNLIITNIFIIVHIPNLIIQSTSIGDKCLLCFFYCSLIDWLNWLYPQFIKPQTPGAWFTLKAAFYFPVHVIKKHFAKCVLLCKRYEWHPWCFLMTKQMCKHISFFVNADIWL